MCDKSGTSSYRGCRCFADDRDISASFRERWQLKDIVCTADPRWRERDDLAALTLEWLRNEPDEMRLDVVVFDGFPTKLLREIRTRSSEIEGFLPASFKAHGLPDVIAGSEAVMTHHAACEDFCQHAACALPSDRTMLGRLTQNSIQKLQTDDGFGLSSFEISQFILPRTFIAQEHDKAFLLGAVECIVSLHEREVRDYGWDMQLDVTLETFLQAKRFFPGWRVVSGSTSATVANRRVPGIRKLREVTKDVFEFASLSRRRQRAIQCIDRSEFGPSHS